jgi:uncharacterized membrane protein
LPGGPVGKGCDTRHVLLFAHAGHWISSLLILLPTVAFIIWLVAITVRDRRRERGKQIER